MARRQEFVLPSRADETDHNGCLLPFLILSIVCFGVFFCACSSGVSAYSSCCLAAVVFLCGTMLLVAATVTCIILFEICVGVLGLIWIASRALWRCLCRIFWCMHSLLAWLYSCLKHLWQWPRD